LKYLQDKIDHENWYCVTNQLIPPVGSSCFGIQGYKTIAYELYEQLENNVVDYIFVPTCRGDLLYGIYEGFQDLITQKMMNYLPHLVAVEPIPRLERVLLGEDHKCIFDGNTELTPSLGGGTVTYQSLLAIQKTKGFAISISQNKVMDNILKMAGYGLYLETSSAILYGCLEKAVLQKKIPADAQIVLIATSHGFKNDPDYFKRINIANLIHYME
jgi:threonine synthase